MRAHSFVNTFDFWHHSQSSCSLVLPFQTGPHRGNCQLGRFLSETWFWNSEWEDMEMNKMCQQTCNEQNMFVTSKIVNNGLLDVNSLPPPLLWGPEPLSRLDFCRRVAKHFGIDASMVQGTWIDIGHRGCKAVYSLCSSEMFRDVFDMFVKHVNDISIYFYCKEQKESQRLRNILEIFARLHGLLIKARSIICQRHRPLTSRWTSLSLKKRRSSTIVWDTLSA